MLKKSIFYIACILSMSACSVNFLRAEFGYIDHHIALEDLIRSEWHLKKTGINPYNIQIHQSVIPDYITKIYSNDKRHINFPKQGYLFEIQDPELVKEKDFLISLFNSPCKAKVMKNDDMSHYQPAGLGFPFGRMKSIIRCPKGYYTLKQIDQSTFVIQY
ncbi:hypothetical protein NYR76_08775 [Actinobacillus equuli subsp. equuli]|uniref:hypothetical protein n=1 Tax=Actinobacillus equuli TaxID=718 RepID=UPI0024414E8E|nr:hypothetical protein [Actinobacillus equuli]WGE64954.1 hypothetical protein NYR76_08775 [Actinobacillus equuli subsp. equuli]WGE81149.1 hypothetical protein NYR66_09465 [Actinobacillus equuli subsp. haemolyticus]